MTTTTTTLFTSASAKGFTPIRGLKGVCARINCGADNCTEKAFIFRNNAGKVINACTCGWRRVAPPAKKWGKVVNKAPRVNEEVEAAFNAKKAAAIEAMLKKAERVDTPADNLNDVCKFEAYEQDQVNFKPDMS